MKLKHTKSDIASRVPINPSEQYKYEQDHAEGAFHLGVFLKERSSASLLSPSKSAIINSLSRISLRRHGDA